MVFPAWPKFPAVIILSSCSSKGTSDVLRLHTVVFYLEEQFTRGLKGFTDLGNMFSRVLTALR